MSSFTPHSKHFKLPLRPLQATPVKSLYTGRHATVNCQACNRTMVPRVVTYYGQPLRSVCPFCGATFMKFSSGLQRLLRHFHSRTLSFTSFKWLAIVALCFGFLWLISLWDYLPDEFSLLATYGTVMFVVMSLAELFVQCVEHTAAKLSHESNHYWAILILIVMVTASFRHDLSGYIFLFFLVMLVRWLIVGMMQAIIGTRE